MKKNRWLSIEKGYTKKVEALKTTLPDFETLSILDLWSRLSLSDDEIYYVATLEIEEQVKNSEWEGFGSISGEDMRTLVNNRVSEIKTMLCLKK